MSTSPTRTTTDSTTAAATDAVAKNLQDTKIDGENISGGSGGDNKTTSEQVACVTIQQFGKLLKKTSIARPVAGEGEVLVHVRACGVNFADLQVKQGLFENLPKLPFVPGFECAGEIVQLGPNTTGYQIGERVICLPRFNAWSEYMTVSVNCIYKIPETMTFKDAAALSYNYLTAYILLFEVANIKSGQTLLFHSAGGGVGIALTQLSKLVSNVTIIATCSKNKFGALKHHVTHVFDENGTIDYAQEIKKLYPEGIDVVLDCLSGEHTNKGISLIKSMGKYVVYGTAKNLEGESKNYFTLAKNWWQVDKVNPLKLYEDNTTVSGFNLQRFLFNDVNSRRYILEIFSKLFALYREGKIKPVIDSIHSFDNISNALAQLQERKNIGKVLLDPYFDSKDSRIKIEKDRHSSDTSGPDEADEPEPAGNDDLL